MKILALLAACLLAGCAANAPLRDDSESTCADMRPCSDSYYERHPNYEIGFVEYSERGNDFAPARTQRLIDQLKRYSARGDIAMVVFIHGWKHNAGRDDGNVASFNKALANLASSGVLGKRRLVGLYVGWRGKSMHGLYSENLTYWDRKAVAEEVGRGGVAELLAQLERIDRKDRNYLVIVGHSFGGAITLGALHDPLLERLLALQDGQRIRAFGDAVIMLNPAIEANQGLLLKENSLKVGALGTQPPPLLYVISSHGDSATHFAFPLGQWVGVNLTWSQVDLGRTYNGIRYRLREEDLDTTALGNYSLYRTALLIDRECPLPDGSDNCAPRPRTTGDRRHRYRQMALQELLQRGRRQRRSGAAAHALLQQRAGQLHLHLAVLHRRPQRYLQRPGDRLHGHRRQQGHLRTYGWRLLLPGVPRPGAEELLVRQVLRLPLPQSHGHAPAAATATLGTRHPQRTGRPL
ncbi:hypothetical protein P4112_30460 [Pseudomonas aeruginosa]|nr:hypothetical protein [Pseudomonas aeruginosa]